MSFSLDEVIPYRVRIKTRRLYQSSKDHFYTIFRRDPLIPPPSLHDIGGAEFSLVGEEFLRFFIELGGLQPHHDVLDLGCGTGRMARPLTKYLRSGHYDGIDIVEPSIRWCQKIYGSSYPNFRFHWADISNSHYAPQGKNAACDYQLPFGTGAFDFVCLASVFTHMLRPEVENYLSEVARVLKPHGRCLISYFLLNLETRQLIQQGASVYDFKHGLSGCFVYSLEAPEGAVAHEESFVRDAYAKRGLNIVDSIHYGVWCGRQFGLSFQDLVIAAKA